jgi:uncharacterized protein
VSKTALITGASGGIGYELGLLFAKDGFDCILVARSEDKLKELAARLENECRIKTLVIAKDLSRPSAVDEIYEAVTATSMQVDVLVNNAGFPVFGLFVETDLQVELEMLQVNVVALTALSKLFLKGMVARRSGRILNLASTAAFEPGPLMAVYYASKAYVLSFSEAISNELRGTGVTVTALCPGPTRTGFQKRGVMEDSRLVRGDIADARSVALAGYRGLMAGKTIVIPGFSNKLVPWIVRVSPRGIRTASRSNSVRPAEARGEVAHQSDPLHSHLHFITQGVTVHPERPANRGHRFSGGRARHVGTFDINSPAFDPAQGDFRETDRLCDDELHPAVANQPEIACLGVHRLTGVDRLRPLAVDQERLAVVGEPDLLAIAEGLDARVLTLTLPAPGAEQEGHGRKRRVQLGGDHDVGTPAAASSWTRRTSASLPEVRFPSGSSTVSSRPIRVSIPRRTASVTSTHAASPSPCCSRGAVRPSRSKAA